MKYLVVLLDPELRGRSTESMVTDFEVDYELDYPMIPFF